MKLSKKDLKCIGAFTGVGSLKKEMNYALVCQDGVFATDGMKAIMFHSRGKVYCEELLVHKKVLKGFENLLCKDGEANIVSSSDGASLFYEDNKLSLDGASFDYVYPNVKLILGKKYSNHFIISKLNNIIFELTQKYCFISSSSLAVLIEHGGADKYDVFYRPSDENDNGGVKIIATKVIDDEEVILYTAVFMGIDFKSEIKEVLL